jgi:thiol-disulfide isomerase/thioredoxin
MALLRSVRSALSAAPKPRRRTSTAAALVATALGAFVATSPLPALGRATVAAPAPDFELVDLDGRSHRLSAERGRIVLLDFWASWCAPCAEELGCLVDLSRRHGEDVSLVAVTIDRDADTARDFLAKRPLAPAKVLQDGGSDVLAEYGADGLPALYLIDREGVVREVHDGAGGCRAIEPKLGELLAPGAGVDGAPSAP